MGHPSAWRHVPRPPIWWVSSGRWVLSKPCQYIPCPLLSITLSRVFFSARHNINETIWIHKYLVHLQSSVDGYPWSNLDWHSIDTSADTLSTLHQHLSWQSEDSNFRSFYMSQSTLGATINRLLIKCPLSVDQVSTKYRPSINWDIHWVLTEMSVEGIDWEYQSISIADAFIIHDQTVFVVHTGTTHTTVWQIYKKTTPKSTQSLELSCSVFISCSFWTWKNTPTSTLFTTVFIDTRLWKTKHPRKRFQNFRQSYVLLTDRIEIHQSQPLAWPSDLLYVMLAGCNWWILIWYVDNT